MARQSQTARFICIFLNIHQTEVVDLNEVCALSRVTHQVFVGQSSFVTLIKLDSAQRKIGVTLFGRFTQSL